MVRIKKDEKGTSLKLCDAERLMIIDLGTVTFQALRNAWRCTIGNHSYLSAFGVVPFSNP
jgi:hypothetical protein